MRSLVNYDGHIPCNVFTFLILFFLQYAVLAFLIVIQVGRNRLHTERAVVQIGYLWIFERASRFVREHWPTPGLKSQWHAGLGVLKARASSYSNLWYWPLVSLAAAVMLSFNLGAFGCFFVRAKTTDLAFCWESSEGHTAEDWDAAVRVLSVPWQFSNGLRLTLPDGRPSLTEIRESRFVAAKGIDALADMSYKAWVPFLKFTVLIYGVGLRTVFVVLARLNERRAIRNIEFNDVRAREIVERMRNARVDIRPILITGPTGPEVQHGGGVGSRGTGNDSPERCSPRLVLMWGGPWDGHRLAQVIQSLLKWPCCMVRKVPRDEAQTSLDLDGVEEIVIAVNARRPPTGDLRRLATTLTGTQGQQRTVKIADCAGANEAQRKVWASQIKEWGDRYVDERLLEATL